MSFNLRYDNDADRRAGNGWDRRLPLVLETIRAHDPDIVGFQEALSHQRGDLERALSDYDSYGEGRDHGGQGEQCAIFWKAARFSPSDKRTFWLNESGKPHERGWDAALCRICSTVTLDGLQIFNAHLDHVGTRARREAIRLIAAQMRAPAVLMGDFNQHGVEAWLPQLTHCRPPARPGQDGTFHDFTGQLDGERIDYIFVTPPLRCESAERLTDRSLSSDHFPVIARIHV